MRSPRAVAAVLALGLLVSGCSGSAAEPPVALAGTTPVPTPVAGSSLETPTALTAATAATAEVRRRTRVVKHGPRDSKRIALTFDADLTPGMRARLRSGEVESYYNADLIRVLRRLEVPATMFLTGLWMDTYPEVTEDLAGDPLFELGTHSQTHRAFTSGCYGLATVPRKEMLAEVTHPAETLAGLDTGATDWFRFPGGCYDDTALRKTAKAGVTAIGTDLAGGDGHARSAKSIANTVLRGVRNGTIVTLHMHGGEVVPLTDEATALIVPALRERGYELVTVTELLAG